MKNKKGLYIGLVALDVAIVIFLFIISILVIVRTSTYPLNVIREQQTDFVAYLIQHSGLYFGLFVVPLFLLLAGNIVILLIFVKKQNQKQAQKVELNDLSDEQKEELRKALMEDMNSKE